MTDLHLPPELEPDIYGEIYSDLSKFSDEQLAHHYATHGRSEGRRANRLVTRSDFASLISGNMRTLEIGPFTNPIASGANVAYADYLDQNELIERAKVLKRDYSQTPFIDYILSKISLADIEDNFDALISSHCIEHQPDLVRHLLDVQQLIEETCGRYFLLIPDKRYCFDRFHSESTIAEVLDAHKTNRVVHTLKSIIEHMALTTHNNSSNHWNTPLLDKPSIDSKRIEHAIRTWEKSEGEYVDVHAWYFTPSSFFEIITLLKSLRMIKLDIERIYSTRRGGNEFWAVLKYSNS